MSKNVHLSQQLNWTIDIQIGQLVWFSVIYCPYESAKVLSTKVGILIYCQQSMTEIFGDDAWLYLVINGLESLKELFCIVNQKLCIA